MGIKHKRSGPRPTYSERWQELATNAGRLHEARQAYQKMYPNATLIESHRAVAAFSKKHIATWGN
mgnify:CR=1 FL=1